MLTRETIDSVIARYYEKAELWTPESGNIARKEFGVLPWSANMQRHESFRTPEDLRQSLVYRTPKGVYAGVGTFLDPGFQSPVASRKPNKYAACPVCDHNQKTEGKAEVTCTNCNTTFDGS